MPAPSLSRLALVFSLGVSSLVLHAACARSVSSDVGADSLGLFGPDAGDAAPQNRCVETHCPAPYATCPGESGLCTTNLTNDVKHCGSCEGPCPTTPPNASPICSGGQCRLICDPLFADCNHAVADGCETGTESDPANCGACGNACKAGLICWRGACGCPNGYTACGTECKRLDSDSENCSACGNVCHAPADDADPAWRCGANVTPANTKWLCASSACELDCKPGFGNCNKDLCADGCEINLLVDPANCGSCGHKCEAGQSCESGSCMCPPGSTYCNGTCVDVKKDPLNCGSCGRRCPGPIPRDPSRIGSKPSGGTPTCDDGRCSYTCFPGFADCDLEIRNGCEVNVLTNPYHCGSCTTQCNIGAGQPCVVGKCLTRECEAGTVL